MPLRALRVRKLVSWYLQKRPLVRSLPSGAMLEVGDIDSFRLYDAIFRREMYARALERAGQVRTVIDLGCNIGFFFCYLRHFFGRTDFRGFGMDANVTVLEQAERHLGRNGLNRIELFNGLVGSTSEASTRDFYVHVSHLKSSQFVRPGAENNPVNGWSRVEVPVFVPGEIWRDGYGDEPIDLLKIDIEGSEGKLLQGDPALFWQTRCVVLRWHKGFTIEEEIFPVLRSYGFDYQECLDADRYAELWFFSREE